jgi:hypothetical protein
MDWPSFNLDHNIPSEVREQGMGIQPGTIWNEPITQLNDTSLRGPGENLYDIGHGYYPVFRYNPSKPNDGSTSADMF